MVPEVATLLAPSVSAGVKALVELNVVTFTVGTARKIRQRCMLLLLLLLLYRMHKEEGG